MAASRLQHWISPRPKPDLHSLWTTSTSHLCHIWPSNSLGGKDRTQRCPSQVAATRKKEVSRCLRRHPEGWRSTPLTTIREMGLGRTFDHIWSLYSVTRAQRAIRFVATRFRPSCGSGGEPAPCLQRPRKGRAPACGPKSRRGNKIVAAGVAWRTPSAPSKSPFDHLEVHPRDLMRQLHRSC